MRITDFVVVLGDKEGGVLAEDQETVSGTLIHSRMEKSRLRELSYEQLKLYFYRLGWHNSYGHPYDISKPSSEDEAWGNSSC